MSMRSIALKAVRMAALRRLLARQCLATLPGKPSEAILGAAVKATAADVQNDPQRHINVPSRQVVTKMPPLTVPLMVVPPPQTSSPVKQRLTGTKMTRLPNGLRIATEPSVSPFCTVGVVVKSGCRYEDGYPSGIAMFLERLNFVCTKNYPTIESLTNELARMGGLWECHSSRDVFTCTTTVVQCCMESILFMLSDIILHPTYLEEDVDAVRAAIQMELHSMMRSGQQTPILKDMIHKAAYGNNTLGLPKYNVGEQLKYIDRSVLMHYLKHTFTPERIVLTGVGIEHEEMVTYVKKYFTVETATWMMDASAKNSSFDIKPKTKAEKKTELPKYVGSAVLECCQLGAHAVKSVNQLAHVMLGFKSCSQTDPDYAAVSVLNVMMGGGNAFSSGGPGKGMLSRLYLNVLGNHHWIFSATAYNRSYADAGFFYIYASAPPGYLRDLLQIMVRELMHMTIAPPAEELQRCKAQLQSSTLMRQELQPLQLGEIGRQVLTFGQRCNPEEFVQCIEEINAEDIVRVAKRILNSNPSLAARGNLDRLPFLKDIKRAFTHGATLPRRSCKTCK